MKRGLSKRQKTTNIFFDEESPVIEVITYNRPLIRRLKEYSEKFPEQCQLIDRADGQYTYEIQKGRLSFRLTTPYDDSRRLQAKEHAEKRLRKGQSL